MPGTNADKMDRGVWGRTVRTTIEVSLFLDFIFVGKL